MTLSIADRPHHSHLILIMLLNVPHHYPRVGAHKQRRVLRAPSILLHQMLHFLVEKTQRRDEKKPFRLVRRGDIAPRSELNTHEMLLLLLLLPGLQILLRQIHNLRIRSEQQPRDLVSNPQIGFVIHIVVPRLRLLGNIEAQIAENRTVLGILESNTREIREDAEHHVATTENLLNVVGSELCGVAHATRERVVPLEIATGCCKDKKEFKKRVRSDSLNCKEAKGLFITTK